MNNVTIPGLQYLAIAKLFVRIHNGGLTTENFLQIMRPTLGNQDEAEYSDLVIWCKNEERIIAQAEKFGITLNPTRVTRALEAIKFITPTTPLCTDPKCCQYTVTNERGVWEVVQPGKSCPVKGCNEKVRKTEVQTHRCNWINGQKVAITQEFDRDHGAEPVPLTEQGIKDFLANEGDAIHGFYAAVIANEGLGKIPEPYVRILNVLACHPEFASKFTAGPKQIIQALVTPKAFGIGRNDLMTIGELAAQQWWVKEVVVVQPTSTAANSLRDKPGCSRGAVRQRMRKLLKTDSDLNQFALDYFPVAKSRFTNDMDRVSKENLILELYEPGVVDSALDLCR